MPYVEDGPDGPQWITKAGVNMGLVGGIGSVGGKFVPGQNYRVDKMAETGLYEDGKKGVRRPGDPDQRIKDMDRDGVDAEVIFGILGVASRVRDPEAANEMLRIYNGWLRDFCSHHPDRQIGLACLPYGDIDSAVEEVCRVAKLGLKGLELSCSGTWIQCGTRSGIRCGKRSTMSSCRSTSILSRQPRQRHARRRPVRRSRPRASPASPAFR